MLRCRPPSRLARMRIRRAQLRDLSALLTLSDSAESAARWNSGHYHAVLKAPRKEHMNLVIEGDDRSVVAFLVAHTMNEEWEIENIVVAKPHRRKGIAAKLLHHLLKAAQARKAKAVLLEVRESNEAARALYEREGFVIVGRRKQYYSRPDEDAVILRHAIRHG